ncbi:response regulator [Bacillus sp. HMF5848]|uniref:response regulator n=1 Tax=Bacillus sp. HMF5848 TaxID=2495421 RepID=UPI000F79FE73|nr:response regulator [Bacillus sp. HMF5848]RSK29024.1 response regulator [Bacillus sp. HMF5848]
MTTILIIDDNEDIRFTMVEICSFAGWDAIQAKDGKEGVSIFKNAKPDIVIVDYHMPNWDGVRTVREIRKISSTVPIIMLTIDENQRTADNCLSVGATDFSLKPIKAPDLISRIRLHLRFASMQKDAFTDKGISASTLGMIKHCLEASKEPLSITDIEKQLPLAYQTIHRYVNYLVETGDVEIIADYGKVGRPKNRYQIS